MSTTRTIIFVIVAIVMTMALFARPDNDDPLDYITDKDRSTLCRGLAVNFGDYEECMEDR
jgi:hypothetical protein